MIPYTIEDGQVRFKVHVVPGSSRGELAGTQNDSLRVRVAARPVEGAAQRRVDLDFGKDVQSFEEQCENYCRRSRTVEAGQH